MANIVKIRKNGHTWELENEATLEDLLWLNLSQTLGLTPLARQFSVSGQICDILAVSQAKELVILELKNQSDRYIVNQLTRYYDALLEKQIFTEHIDYSQPVRLIAIAPNFHKDNFTDRKYSRLSVTFLQFNIVEAQSHLFLELRDVDNQSIKKLEIPVPPDNPPENIPSPPRALRNLLAKSPEIEQQGVLKTRERLLAFHPRIKELSIGYSIVYGVGKTNLCAEVRFDKERNAISLFLWLPHLSSRRKQAKKGVCRMRLWTDWTIVSDIGHVPQGLGRKISFEEWQAGNIRPLSELLPRKDIRDKFFTDPEFRKSFTERKKVMFRFEPHYKSGLAMRIEEYQELIGKLEEPSWSNSLEYMVDLALETWAEKRKKP
ncbi:MAG: DUF91 domain-containing protein [Symploca sp. SIO2G7]|nr:DUF91 domain-containing protein [Symploca sp. SIO2G7]